MSRSTKYALSNLRATLQILQVLSEKEGLNGAQIRQQDPTIPRGSLYTTLRKLEKLKLVDSAQELVADRSGMPRRYYFLTQKGQRIHELLSELEKVLKAK